MRGSVVEVAGALWLAWAALGCELRRAEDPAQRDEAWRARVEAAHAYAARKVAQPPAQPATAEAATPGATPQALLAPEPSPVQPPPSSSATAKKHARRKKAKGGALPPGRMALEVIEMPDGRGPRLIEITRTEQASTRGAR